MAIKVIVDQQAQQAAYDLGYELIKTFGNIVPEQTQLDLSAFRSSEEYANHILPDLRALAGFSDAGHGTYQVNEDIVVVDEADLDDTPIEGDELTAEMYVDELVNKWNHGARDAFDAGSEYGDSL